MVQSLLLLVPLHYKQKKPLPSISSPSPMGSVLTRQSKELLSLGLAPQGPQLSWWLWN